MTELTRRQQMLMMEGGVLMFVAEAFVIAMKLSEPAMVGRLVLLVMPCVFLCAAVLFFWMQRKQQYQGTSLAIRRLMGIRSLAGILLILAGVFMVEDIYRFTQFIVVADLDSFILYSQIVNNNWVVLSLIGALLELYATLRLSSALKKEP